jgi:hypothetical protein
MGTEKAVKFVEQAAEGLCGGTLARVPKGSGKTAMSMWQKLTTESDESVQFPAESSAKACKFKLCSWQSLYVVVVAVLHEWAPDVQLRRLHSA